MNQTSLNHLFQKAAEIDATLNPNNILPSRIARKRVPPSAYTRDSLFKNMADGQVSVFNDYPSPLRYLKYRNQKNHGEIVLRSYLESGLTDKIRIKTGKAKTVKYFTVDQLVEKWQRGRMVMNVTDFHFRETEIEMTVDPKRINEFNLYPVSPSLVGELEMMTLVMSSVGGFSDSHSDDSDGSNHCFVGQKLWLAWDTNEGLANGLDDVDKVDVFGSCQFDLATWLSLKSARWFTVEAGQTLFMPGHLTHKVITLQPYLGVGSFFLAMPNVLRTLSRWLLYTPNWENLEPASVRDQLYFEAVEGLASQVEQLEKSTEIVQHKWGMDYLGYAAKSWKKQFNNSQRQQVLSSDYFQSMEPAMINNIAA